MKHSLLRIHLAVLCVTGSLFGPVEATPFCSVARDWNEQILSAIRKNVPNPPAHARNLFHTAVAMYDCWAAYDATAIGYLINEKVLPLPANIEASRHEAISYAAYNILRSRFFTADGSNGWAATQVSLDAELTRLGYSRITALAPITKDPAPAELGKRIADAILRWGQNDGFANTTYPQPYDITVNPNMAPARALIAMGNNGEFPTRANMQLGLGIPLREDYDHYYSADTDPNFWQPLALASFVTQNGIPTAGGIQGFVGVQSLATTPFCLKRSDPSLPWLDPFGGPSRLGMPASPSNSDAAYKAGALSVIRSSSKLNDPTLINISPGGTGNNPRGTDSGTGRPLNPVTQTPYAPNMVSRGDFTRVLSEFWADGPKSETPPGHWHVLANQVSDHPLTVKKIRGTGPVVNNLEWDVKTYFALSAATHDAACAAWALKRCYSGPRPITAIRYMAAKGQSSNPLAQSYHPQGLPLEAGVSELITKASSDTGQRHELIWDVYTQAWQAGAANIGKVVVFSWPGEHPGNAPAPSIATNANTVRWMKAIDWLPFQRKTFNTPAFPGYISGHSTFSAAAAEVLTLITGSPYFPGGFHHQTISANSMQIDLGPGTDVDLQWCTYLDAADQAGLSRRYGGIHVPEDDYDGRWIGNLVGGPAFALAEKYWNGTILNEEIGPAITRLGDGTTTLTWSATRGRYHHIQSSTDLTHWSPEPTPAAAISYLTTGTWTDPDTSAAIKFYRIIRSDSSIP